MDRKTKIEYKKIPHTAQYKGAKWDGLKDKKSQTLDLSQSFAKNNPDVNYFFQVRNGFTLEKTGDNPDRTFSSNDSVFFNNDHLWLGSAQDYADTYLVAETYDLTDNATKNDILAELRSNFLIGGLDTSAGTTAIPIEVKAGFVFVQFNDVRDDDGDIENLRQKLKGPNVNGVSALENFISTESNGQVELILETYQETDPKDSTKKSDVWVTLPKNLAEYNVGNIAGEVDKIIEFPDDWKIAVFAFPDKAKVKGLTLDKYGKDGFWIDVSQCFVSQVDANKQSIQCVFMDPSHYNQTHNDAQKTQIPTHITTIHEVMHALNLPDLYYSNTNRSYGWSIMSAAGAGSHITQFEKLLLGWEDTSKFVFLKRGMIPADDLLNDKIKGIVILPGVGREDTYFIEKAQQIGIGDNNKTAFDTANKVSNKINYGLLLMIFRKDRQDGKIIPFVCKHDSPDDRLKYGGASKAPFKDADSFDTNGISSFSTPNYTTDKNETISRIICVTSPYKLPEKAQILRENEKIVSGSLEFKSDTSGYLLPLSLDCNNQPITYNLFDTGYGYALFVDGNGTLKLARATDDKALPDTILYTFPKPQDVNLAEGKYYFKVGQSNTDATKSCIAIYKEGENQSRYIACREVQIHRNDLCFSDENYEIWLNDGGNLVVTKKDKTFITGSVQQCGFDVANTYGITFVDKVGGTENGKMLWLKADGTTLKTFSGTSGVGPFNLAVEKDGADYIFVVVKDSTGKKLYTVFGNNPKYIFRNEQTTDGDYKITLGDDGNLLVMKGDNFITGSYQIFGKDIATATSSIAFAENGAMQWLDISGNEVKSFSGTSGVGPFRLAVQKGSSDKLVSLFVKDSTDKTLYTVYSNYIKRNTTIKDGDYEIKFDDGGNLSVSKNGSLIAESAKLIGSDIAIKTFSIFFDAAGKMSWLDNSGNEVKAFPCTSGIGSFNLAVKENADKTISLLVKDSGGNELCTVYTSKP